MGWSRRQWEVSNIEKEVATSSGRWGVVKGRGHRQGSGDVERFSMQIY